MKKEDFIKPQMARRTVMVLLAQVIMGFAVALLKLVTLGTDPYAAMMLALTDKTPLNYGTFLVVANCVIFLGEIKFGKKYIGLGTLANWFLLGYMVMFWSWVFGLIVPETLTAMTVRLPLCIIGIIILGFSLSLYQSADIGSSPYDSIPLMMRDHLHLPFFISRVILDAIAVVICLAADGLVGLGTLLIVIGLGPVAGWFNTHFSEKLLTEASAQ